MATKEQREKARALIERGTLETESGAKFLNEAWELLGKPRFQRLRVRPSENLHDVRAHTQRLDAYARSDIYHDESPDCVDGAEEGPRQDALHRTLTADITRLVGSLDWALRWIETNGEVPLDDDEPEEFAQFQEAKALMAPPEDEPHRSADAK